MKIFVRLIRRYLLTAAAIVLLLAALWLTFMGHLVWQESTRGPQWEYPVGSVADSMVQTADGLAFGPQHTPEEWMDGYAWAMVLDDTGDLVWSYALPENLAHSYTPADVARFTRWYLDDYPVFCWAADYGLFVVGLPKDSLVRYTFYSSRETVQELVGSILPIFLSLLGVILLLCFLLSWRGAKELLAIARRDNARTQWIAGVSHDVRTPLALILGWAQQLENDPALPEASRRKAGGIRAQSETLRTLIEDLNLTSKLEYGAQPLRRVDVTAGPLLRSCAARFCDTPAGQQCELELVLSPAAETARLHADTALLGRAVENLLSNCVRHNPAPVAVILSAAVEGRQLLLTVADNGSGYPPAVLEALHDPDPPENAPHILGLHVVEQITEAHGGTVQFTQNTPHGAKAVLRLPLA